MLLVYIDESGISYKKNRNGYFIDGPYAIWGGVLINDEKYSHLERSFFELKEKYLPSRLRNSELHASVIWNYVNKRGISKRSKEKIKIYFEELFQLLAKLHVGVVFSIQQKNPRLGKGDSETIDKELERARFSFLHILEHELASLNQTGILIADLEGESEYGEGGREQINKMKTLVHERTLWRVQKEFTQNSDLTPKFEFEYRSNFILDQLHYINSKESLFIQLVDHICYILRRSLECIYLKYYPKEGRPLPNSDLVPISENTFNFFVQSSICHFGHYNNDDVTFDSLSEVNLVNIEFSRRSGGRLFVSSQDILSSKVKSFTPFG